MRTLILIGTILVFYNSALAGDGPLLTTVKHLTRVNILQSNNVSLRPGSMYDNMTYFELFLGWTPNFHYEFLDSGLGAAEPLYPMYQRGFQGSWFQLIPAFFSETSRHIDHYSSLDTPEGCRVDGIYLLRDITEYPERFALEKQQGYTLVVTRLEHYLKLRPDAQCGRHRANDPDPNFDHVKFMADHANAMSLDDFPQEELKRFEAKLSVIYHVKEEMNPEWPLFDTDKFNNNSLWFYPNGHAPDFGIDTPRPQAPFEYLSLPRDLVVNPSDSIRDRFNLSTLVKPEQFNQVMNFVTGRPTPDFDPRTEPGLDTLDLTQSNPTYNYVYTSGLEMEPIQNALADVSNPGNFKLVGMTIKPYEEQEDPAWKGTRMVPQIRFVYQLMDPRNLNRPMEQFYIHVKYDVIDRYLERTGRDQQHYYFLQRLNLLTASKNTPEYETNLVSFIEEFTQSPVESIAWSSSMTGIWVFGTLAKEQNSEELRPVRIVRNGIDVGFYSSVYDNDLFRTEIERSEGNRKASLKKHMNDLTVSYFRDPKRHDPHSVSFNRVTCAQCHQTAGRDGVHMAFNDELDRRITTRVRSSEHLYLEADRQLVIGQDYWKLRRFPTGRAE